MTLKFVVHAIQLKTQEPFNQPDCYHFIVNIIFDNSARTGKICQRLDTDSEYRSCASKIIDADENWTLVRRDLFITLDCFVLIITIISFVLCIRSLWIRHMLCREVCHYFAMEKKREPKLPWRELQVFYSFWYILMIITDLLIVPGTIIKLTILFKVIHRRVDFVFSYMSNLKIEISIEAKVEN